MIQALDVGLVLFVGAFAFLGLRSGLIHESVTIFGLAIGLFVGGRLSERFYPIFLPWLHTRGMATLAAFLVILFAAWGLTVLLGGLVRALLQDLRLGWLDNLGGALFGIAKGLFLAEVAILVLMVLPNSALREAIERSWLVSRLAAIGPDIVDLVPPVLRYWKPF